MKKYFSKNSGFILLHLIAVILASIALTTAFRSLHSNDRLTASSVTQWLVQNIADSVANSLSTLNHSDLYNIAINDPGTTVTCSGNVPCFNWTSNGWGWLAGGTGLKWITLYGNNIRAIRAYFRFQAPGSTSGNWIHIPQNKDLFVSSCGDADIFKKWNKDIIVEVDFKNSDSDSIHTTRWSKLLPGES